MAKQTVFVVLASIIDIVMSTILFVNGDKWELFPLSIVDYSFPTSFIDIWLWTILRNCIITGCVIGVVKNSDDGPRRLKQVSRFPYFIACMNGFYSCVKLLVFSEQPEFVMGPTLKWFWGLFAWNLFGIVVFIAQWNSLESLCSDFSPENETKSSSTHKSTEKQPLMSKSNHVINDYSSIDEVEVCIENGKPRIVENAKSKSKHERHEGKDISDGKEDKKDETDKKGMSELVNRATVGKMVSFVIHDWPLIIVGVVFLIGAAVSQIFLPLYTGKVITGIVVSGDHSQFTKSLIEMAAISLVASICSGIRGGCFTVCIQRLNIRVRNALFSSFLNQEIGFFDKTTTGEILSRLTSDITTMTDTIGLNFNVFLRSVIKALGVCVFMFALSWRLFLVPFLGLPLIFAVSKVYGKYYKKLQEEVQNRFAHANEVAEEVCSSMITVRSFANEEGEKKRYSNRLSKVFEIQLKQAFSYSGYVWSTQIFTMLFEVLVLAYGGHLVLNKLMSAESIMSFVLYQYTMSDCISTIGAVYTGLMQALGAAEKVFELIERTPAMDIHQGHQAPDDLEGRIKFDNVTFAYPTRKDQPVLENVSFEVSPGEVVALVGPSGGGKSSCVKLLERFYDCSNGQVLIDGRPLNQYKHEFLHEKVALVGQEPVLFARSIHDNILYGLDENNYTNYDVTQAAITANAHNFINELYQGYQTETGEKGTQMSGGQKQRVAIARALVRNPRILLLDEATSALDTESEFLVQEALERSKADRTVLLIAHRLSTVERADRIVVIVKGKVVETGNHRELMEKQGLYYKLVYRQLHQSTQPTTSNDLENSDDVIVDDVDQLQTSQRAIPRKRSISSNASSSYGSSCSPSSFRLKV
uniref:ATP-binding cassette sub-family B member 9-like n=1 Tax=Phallusia mammillata TaxID=59560 RepID=A0A6F9D4X5_9ASCI|nr:ATP-binding cassette sub-family B member 9-like [Phallusia mammillata]